MGLADLILKGNSSSKSISEAPLFTFNERRRDLVREVAARVYNTNLSKSRTHNNALEYVLNETAIQEIERLKAERGLEVEVRDIAWWRGMARRLGTMSESEKRSILRELIDSYVDDTAGKFNPNVFSFATGALPIGFGLFFKTQDFNSLGDAALHMRSGLRNLRDLSERVVVEGHIDTMQHLVKKGTIVVVPTHSSNMDSILLGWALESVGLPPVTYGAGKNLFVNPLTRFFMYNLGAYKVDRRLQHQLYKDVLKNYSQVLSEWGFHSLFFPGGTRCRSNIVESKLKLGLLGTSVSAYTRNLQSGEDKRVYIVPATINYNLVLEAESLIREHLKREGRSRYFLENDEFDQLSVIAKFVLNTVGMKSTTVIRFGQPMDPFGNLVEADGESYDSHGRRLDPKSYVQSIRTGDFVQDMQRDRRYTRHTGAQISEAFKTNTVLQPSAIVAFSIFETLAARYPRTDVYELLRFATNERISFAELTPVLTRVLEKLRRRAADGKVRLSETASSLNKLLDEGIESLMSFHIPQILEPQGTGLFVNRLDLLYFYGNRVRSFELGNVVESK